MKRMVLDVHRAQEIANDITSKYNEKVGFGTVHWYDVYANLDELVSDIARIVVPKTSVPLYGLYRGYVYIHSFARVAKVGNPLTSAQITQAKRNALQIKIAASIADCWREATENDQYAVEVC